MTHLVRVSMALPQTKLRTQGEPRWPQPPEKTCEFELEVLEEYRQEVAGILRAAAKELDP